MSIPTSVLQDLRDMREAAQAGDWNHYDIVVERLKADLEYEGHFGDDDDD